MPGLRKASIMLILVVLVTTQSVVCCAQGDDILVLFQPGMVQLPNGSNGCTLNEATISTIGLENVLYSVNPDSIVALMPGFDRADTVQTGSEGQAVTTIDWSLAYRLAMPLGCNADSLCSALRQSPGIIVAEPEVVGVPFAVSYPNDPRMADGTQWGLWNTGQSITGQSGITNDDIDAPWAWDSAPDNSSLEIGIIDEGFNSTHEEFAASRFDPASDFSAPNTDTSPGHGFRVAGVVAAGRNNGKGVAGMSSNSKLFVGRFDINTQVLINDIATCTSNALSASTPLVLNMSFGLDNKDGTPAYPMLVAQQLAYAYMDNDVMVAANGKAGTSRRDFPANFGHGVIAVGATDNRDARASFSNANSDLDVVAPGVSIETADMGAADAYVMDSGTSFAAPYVSGIAAMLKSADTNLANDDIRAIIRLSARDLGSAQYDTIFGAGRVNARRALEIYRPPNTFATFKTGSEANPHSVGSTGQYELKIMRGTPQYFYVKRHEVHGHASFSTAGIAWSGGTAFSAHPVVWGRGVFTDGTALEVTDPGDNLPTSFGIPWCDTLPGTTTADGCSLKTYVYEEWPLYAPNGPSIGWYPCAPQDVRFAWSALQVKPTPDPTNSYFVPQAVVAGNVVEGHSASQNFKTCPFKESDIKPVLRNNSRIKVVLNDSAGNHIAGISAADIFVLMNGRSVAQGMYWEGPDSVIASHQYDSLAQCPDVRAIYADGPTNSSGETYVTFLGPGGLRDSTTKWGGFDSELPVYALGVKLQGRAKADTTNGSYTLAIRNVDCVGGLSVAENQGEYVNSLDLNFVTAHQFGVGDYDYWVDFDESGQVNQADRNFLLGHYRHGCLGYR